jgi:polysaccharide deacetylase family protein (PEP-CTERM system associated)
MMVSDITNALTIDVEDYFQVSAFSSHIGRNEWSTHECRIERNMDCLLAILADHQTKATFFTLGWIAERYPKLIGQIVDEGHELASHGYGHERASDQSEASFFADINLAKLILEDLSGTSVIGYRAPSFSIGRANLWAFDCLARAGYHYSSSIYPIHHDHYGMPDAPRFVHEVRPGLMEIPITTLRAFGRNFPSSGGGYFRLFPYAVSRWMLGHVNRTDQQSGIFYCHPWEFDTEQPRIAGISNKTRFRHYVNIDRMEVRMNQLLRDFKWGRMDRVFGDQLSPRSASV